eukprot:TRINITY_DN7374_c0_g1_i4.p3 TRINITY_DN7374_c0_g1~~TRINITY_DN7374_c0_g1_i4.p3  ORF type:complete len:145 (-),score=10.99 TRINITY_DN7374_c0_g1_i4:9-443(-)
MVYQNRIKDFNSVVASLGGVFNATPKPIVKKMIQKGHREVTQDRVKSHLQAIRDKCRKNQEKKEKQEIKKQIQEYELNPFLYADIAPKLPFPTQDRVDCTKNDGTHLFKQMELISSEIANISIKEQKEKRRKIKKKWREKWQKE